MNVTYCKLSVDGDGRVEYHLRNVGENRPIAVLDRTQAKNLLSGLKREMDKKVHLTTGRGRQEVTISFDTNKKY